MTTESDASETAASTVSADVAGEKRKARRARVSVETLPSGTVRVRVRGKRPDGRPFDRSEAFSQGTREERAAAARAAKATLWRWAEEVEAGLVVEEESMTLATLAARLKKDGQAIRLQERSALAGPLRSMQGIDVRELSDAKWAAWVDRQRRAGLSAAYIRKSYHVARKLVGSAVERKWLARLPWAAVSKWLPAEKETHTRRALSTAETRALLDAARAMDEVDESDVALRCRLQHHLAARPVELCRMGPAHLVEVDGVPVLRWQAAKGNGLREVPIPEGLAEDLREQWAKLPGVAKKHGVFFPVRKRSKGWTTRVERRGGVDTGEVFTVSELTELRRRSGIHDFVPYLLRHTGATDVATELGMGAAETMAFLKHSTLRMTNRYVAQKMDPARVALLQRERLGTSAPTPAATVALVPTVGVSPLRPKGQAAQGEERAHGEEVQPDSVNTCAVKPRGRPVGAKNKPRVVDHGDLSDLLERVPALVGLIEAAGGARAWAGMVPAEHRVDVRDDLEALLGSGRLGEDERGALYGAWLVLEEACAHAAERAQILTPKKGVKKAPIVERNNVFRLVGGQSFTSSVRGRSEEE